jgi:hypothetical protein
MIEIVVRERFLLFAIILSLLAPSTEISAGTNGSGSELIGSLADFCGFHQTIPPRKPKPRKKRKTKRKAVGARYVIVPAGIWGGNGIILNIGTNGATVKYDCADGKIEHALRMDAEGNFTANGVHIPGQPGPIRIDVKQTRQPARYVGNVSGDTMSLKVSLTDTSKVIGEFKLELGRTPRIHRCY